MVIVASKADNVRPDYELIMLKGKGMVLTQVGFLRRRKLYPLGPIGTIGAMSMATAKAHWGKPVWITQGGAELPITNIATALALTLLGPGRFSLDRLFGIRLPRWLVITAVTHEPANASSRPKRTKTNDGCNDKLACWNALSMKGVG